MKLGLKILKHSAMLIFVVLPLWALSIVVLAIYFLFLDKDKETLPKYLRWFDNNDAHKVGLPDARVGQGHVNMDSKEAVFDSYVSTVDFSLPSHVRLHFVSSAYTTWIPVENDGTVLYLPDYIDGLIAPDYWRLPAGRFPAYPYVKYNYFKHWYHRMRWTAFRNPLNYFKWNKLGFIWDKDEYIVLYTNNRIDVSDQDSPGTYKVVVELNDKEYFEWYYISKPFKFFGERVIRIRIGWKIGSPHDNDEYHGTLTSWVFAAGLKRVDI